MYTYRCDAACVLYRSRSAPAPAVTEAEDSDGRRWALKRVAGSDQLAREADRLAKLQGHPLIVPLQSIFVDEGVTHLQMPSHPKGNLRIWVEQVKVIHTCRYRFEACVIACSAHAGCLAHAAAEPHSVHVMHNHAFDINFETMVTTYMTQPDTESEAETPCKGKLMTHMYV